MTKTRTAKPEESAVESAAGRRPSRKPESPSVVVSGPDVARGLGPPSDQGPTAPPSSTQPSGGRTVSDPVDEAVRSSTEPSPSQTVEVPNLNLSPAGDAKAAGAVNRVLPRVGRPPGKSGKAKPGKGPKRPTTSTEPSGGAPAISAADLELGGLLVALNRQWTEAGSVLAAPESQVEYIGRLTDVVVAKRLGKVQNSDELLLAAAVLLWLVPRAWAWWQGRAAAPRGVARDTLARERRTEPEPRREAAPTEPDYAAILQRGYAGA